jgi:proline racemase
MSYSKRIRAIDTHVAGEPGRVIVDGVDDVPGDSVFEKMKYLETNQDWLRRLMLREPRGYPAANCNLLVPPCHPEADAGYVIMEHVEYPAMSGTNTIAVATVLIEEGLVPVTEPQTELCLESPAGLIRVIAEVRGGKVKSVEFRNVPAFVEALDLIVDVPNLGEVRVDVAWGGMYYVIADAEEMGIELTPENAGDIVRVGEMIKAATQEQFDCSHPDNPEMRGVTIAQLSGRSTGARSDRKNAVIVSTGALDWSRPATWTGALDRSPCGTGTCAQMAVRYARGELGLDEEFRHEGILGTVFTGMLLEETRIGDRVAVVPTIRGSAWITGFADYVLDAEDPFPEGFTVGDIWATGG